MTSSLTSPLLEVKHDVEKGASVQLSLPERARHWAAALEGCAPLLPQLPMDELGPVEQHREADKVSASAAMTLGAAGSEERMAGLLVSALAALLGRYGMATEVAVGLWRCRDKPGCQPLRVSLLRQPGDTSPVLPPSATEEESSVVTALSAFTSPRWLLNRVSKQVEEGDEHLLSEEGVKALDLLVNPEVGPQRAEGLRPCRSMEGFVVLGGSAVPGFDCPQPPVTVVCPQWPPSKSSPSMLELRCPRGYFSSDSVKRMLGHLVALMDGMMRSQDAALCSLSLHCASTESGMSVDEAEVNGWADAYTSSCYCPSVTGKKHWSADRSMTSMIEASAASSPDSLALLDDGSGAGYTYAELTKLSSSVACELAAAGVAPDALVPFMASRGTAMVLGILGILRTGAGYVPLDLHWPDDRLCDVLEQCSSKVVLAAQDCHVKLTGLAQAVTSVTSVLAVEKTACIGGSLEDRGSGHTMAYTFFTSGTTGKPKGVMVENRGLVHRLHWFQERWPLHKGEGLVAKVAYTFGLSEWEIFWPLVAGATLVLAPPGGEKDPDYLLRRACNAFVPPQASQRLLPGAGPSADSIRIIAAHVFVPSMLQMVFDRYDELEEEEMGRKPGHQSNEESTWWRNSSAREVVTCGEALNYTLAQKMFARFPHCNLTNLYGPTEGEMTLWEVPHGRALSRVSAGAPMGGSKVILTDLRERRPAASLEPAEICFGGPFIARGYLGRKDLDATAFIDDFSSSVPENSSKYNLKVSVADNGNIRNSERERLYLTGDLGRWRAGGNIDLLGRKDFQVKLRGFRIELGEIESAMRAVGARAAVCMLRKGAGGAPALVAYYEPGAEADVPEAVVRSSCQKRLPPYMQPQSIVRLDQLPRNSNGKVDRAKLPDPPASVGDVAGAASGDTPASHAEKTVAGAFAEVLNIPEGKVFMDSDFQDLGGSSLLAGRATALIRKRLQVTGLAGTVIYKHPTVRRLSAVVEGLLQQQENNKDAPEESPGGLALALQPKRSPHSSTSAFSLCMQGAGVFVLNFLFQSQAWSPIWWGAYWIYVAYGRNALFMYLPFAAALDILMMFFVIVILKWILVGRIKPGTIDLWTTEYYCWWFVNTLLSHTLKIAMPLVADTSVANVLMRCLGAKVGAGAKMSVFDLHDPDLLEVGAGVTIGKRAKLATSSVLHGKVHLREIKIGEGAAVGPTAVLSQGSVVPPRKAVLPLSTMPGWHGAVGSVACQDAQPPCHSEAFTRRQDFIRVVFGLPCVLLLGVLPYYFTTIVLEWSWDYLDARFPENAFTIFSIALSWIYAHAMWMSRVVCIVLQKWLLIGDFRKVTVEESHWNELVHWLHGRAVESHDFEEVCDMWINTELLSNIYRALGTKVGRRVQIDQIHFIENDCVSIDDYVVFGTDVLMDCNTKSPWVPASYAQKVQKSQGKGPAQRFADIKICRAANVLDHCTLLPGVTVAERAVLGTCTLAPAGSYYPPLAIHSGSQRGRSIHLRDHNASPALREMEDKTMREVDDPWTWWRFNLIIFLVVIIANPIPEAAWVVTYFAVTSVWDFEEDGMLTLLIVTPFAYNLVEFLLILVQIALKWLVMGKYEAGEYKFFGSYHMRWMSLMIFGTGLSALADCLHGTAFEVWVCRACGAKVGKDCYLGGLVVEYDLLTIGDYVAIGSGCDTTGHTVENMVIKLAPTRLGDGATMLPGSFAMPGSVVEDEAVLMEHTQVLKGEIVPKGEVWAGMPASGCKPISPFSS